VVRTVRWLAVSALCCAVLGSRSLAAQAVLLQIRPHVGDTLRMRLDQTMKLVATFRVDGNDSTATMTTLVRMLTRTIPIQSTATGTMVVMITDSVSVEGGMAVLTRSLHNIREAMEGKEIRLRIEPTGVAEVIEGEEQMRDLLAQMPSSFPDQPVKVGERWTREMFVPIDATSGERAKVRATFQLDSLSANGDLAFISMSGTFAHTTKQGPSRIAKLAGTLSGFVLFHRRLGWVTESKTICDVRTRLLNFGREKRPIDLHLKLTQWLRPAER
jgi:hypothetical protein